MGLDQVFGGMDASVSGLRAERTRMEVVAGNIANADATKAGPSGEPYRRRTVEFAPALEKAIGPHAASPGVRVLGVADDPSPFPTVYRPGDPDANADGYVSLPNVNLAFEMVDLSTATRSYEANLSAIRAFRDMAEQALSIGKS
jgi:flagellar basal-body rod protein FlgC